MLKKIFDSNGEADSNSIAQELKLRNSDINNIGLALKSRGLVRKRVEVKKDPNHPGLVRKKSIWSLRDQNRERTIKLIKEAEN